MPQKTLEASLPTSDFEYQPLVITLHTDNKETVSPQCLLSDFSENITPFTEVTHSLYGSNASRKFEMENQEASSRAPSTVKNDSKTAAKNETFLNLILQNPLIKNRKTNTLSDAAFSTSNVEPPTLKLFVKPVVKKDDSLTPQLSNKKFQFISELTSL